MSNEEFINLAGKIADGTANLTEIALYNLAYETYQQDQQSWKEMELDPEALKAESLHKFWQEVEPVKQRRIRIWPHMAVAASIMICLGIGLFWYGKRSHGPEKLVAENTIVPGGNKAYLTLANGNRIVLSNAAEGKLATEGDVEILKSKGGQIVYSNGSTQKAESLSAYNTIEIPRGGQYQIQLPDGTRVWLNAASRLTYPVSFETRKERIVTLNGEAYFEVAKDKKHPFKVKSQGQEVEVLGTHFNISGYSDEAVIKTTLLEGSVRISSLQGTGLLKPGEQAIYSPGRKLMIVPADLESAVAWKNGDFSFNKENLRSVMQKISRWYDVDIEYKENISDYEFTGTVSRFGNVKEVLHLLELTGMVHFKIEGRRIIVMP